MHGKTAQAHGQQQLREGGVTRHLAAHAHAPPRLTGLIDGAMHQIQHRWVPGVVEVGHGLISAVDGQGVLNQVVGAHRDKIEVPHEQRHGQGRRGHLDHGAELTLAERLAGVDQLSLDVGNVVQRLANLPVAGEHGDEDFDGSMVGRPEQGPQLAAEHAGLGQAPAYGAQPQGGVEHRFMAQLAGREPLKWLVRANVDGANGHGQPAHGLDRAAISFVLFFFVGQGHAAIHEQELAAEQAHADGASVDRADRVFRHFNVGQQIHAFAVQGDGWRVSQAGQATALELGLSLAKTVFLQHDGRGIDDHQPGVAVNDHAVVLAHQAAGLARAHHGRDVHAASHDGRVGGFAPDIGHKTAKHAALEMDHVSRRDVAGDQDQGLIAAKIARTRCAAAKARLAIAAEFAQHALDHLLEVGFALADVGVLHLIELARQHFQLGRQGPFGVVVARTDPVGGRTHQRLILQQHLVHVQDGGQFGWRVGGEVAFEDVKFVRHGVPRSQQACDLLVDVRRVDKNVRHVDATGSHQYRATNGHTSRYRQAENLDAHEPNPNSVRLWCNLLFVTRMTISTSPSSLRRHPHVT